jgi:hypothetical protein
MAELYQKIGNANLLRTWSNDPPAGAVVAPQNEKFASGWAGLDTPPAEWINYLYQQFGEKINHLLQHGIPKWITAKEYTAGDVVVHTSTPWLAVATNTSSAPSGASVNWVPLASGRGITGSMYAAHGADVTVTTTAAAVPVNTNINDSAGSIDHDTVTNNSRFVVNRTGIYEYEFQAHVLTTHASPANCYLWIAKNGTALANSAYVTSAKALNAIHQVTVAGTISLNANDYIELFTKADTNGEYTLDFTATAGGVPAIPSVVVNMKGW